MSETLVNFGSLDAGAAAIMSNFNNLRNELSTLESKLNPMVATWTGDAREAYYVDKQKWESAAEAMAGILQQMSKAVDTAATNYRAAEASNTSRW